MVRRSLFQIIKKKIFLFLSLVFVTTIGVMFSTGFVSCYSDYKRESLAYVNDYGLPDIILNTSTFNDEDVSSIKIEGAEVFYRFQGDADITINNKIYKTRLNTFDTNSFSKRYVVSEVNDSKDKININIDYSFGHLNNIVAGAAATIKINSKTENLFINKLVGNPEAIDYNTGTIVPVDRYNYGYSYINKDALKESVLGISNNQVIVRITDSSKSQETIRDDLVKALSETSKKITTTSTTFKENNPAYKFITSNDRDMKKVAIIVPAVTIGILLIIIFLFMYQVSKSLTHEFGIMIALGNSLKSVLVLLLGFATVVSIVASALGILCGHVFSTIMYNVFKDSFFVPTGYGGVLFPISIFSFLATLVVTYLAVLSTILVIRRISPLEAINNSKNEYKPLIKPVEKIVDKTGVSSKIAITSIFKEKIRSFVSIFAIIASFTICFGSLNLYQSETGIIDQLYSRYNYEAEVYIKDNTKINNVIAFIKEEKSKGVISEYEQSRVAYLPVTGKGNFTFIGIQDSDMHKIVDSNNNRISFNIENTIVIDELYANENGFKKGDKVTINGHEVTVQEICHNCTYKKNYVNYQTLVNITESSSYYETVCINSNDLNKFLEDVSNNTNLSIGVLNMYNYGQTICSGYQALIMLSKGLVALGVVVGFATLIIMAVVSMNEQKRKFSIMQSLGLKLSEVSKVIFIQNCVFLVLGIGIGIPCAKYFAAWMVKICTTKYTVLINFNHWWLYAVVAGMMIVLVAITHLISTIKIKHTNLVANTCSRE